MTDWRDDEWEALMERTRATDDPGASEPQTPRGRPGFWEAEGPGASWDGAPPDRIEPDVTAWATSPEEWSAGADAWGAGQTLEWKYSSPPGDHDLGALPVVHSPEPLLDEEA